MKFPTLLCSFYASSVIAFPWLHPDADTSQFKRGMEAIRRDPETSKFIRELYQQQLKEKRDYFENRQAEEPQEAEFLVEKRATSNCLTHPLPDFYPTNITGLQKFPEAAYPYQDPQPSDQRGPCPGLNTLANHGYINRFVPSQLSNLWLTSTEMESPLLPRVLPLQPAFSTWVQTWQHFSLAALSSLLATYHQ